MMTKPERRAAAIEAWSDRLAREGRVAIGLRPDALGGLLLLFVCFLLLFVGVALSSDGGDAVMGWLGVVVFCAMVAVVGHRMRGYRSAVVVTPRGIEVPKARFEVAWSQAYRTFVTRMLASAFVNVMVDERLTREWRSRRNALVRALTWGPRICVGGLEAFVLPNLLAADPHALAEWLGREIAQRNPAYQQGER